MTEQDAAVDEVTTAIRIVAPEGQTIHEAESLRLEVEGNSMTVLALAEAILAIFSDEFDARLVSASDQDGNLLPVSSSQVDVLSTGDASVEQ